MYYNGTVINNSPTITGMAKNDLGDAQFLAVEYDADGTFKLAGAGANAVGLLMAEASGIKAGGEVDVQVKDIGRWRTGGAVKPGDELTSDANACAVKATSGSFITAIALEGAQTAGSTVSVQIVKAGYKT